VAKVLKRKLSILEIRNQCRLVKEYES